MPLPVAYYADRYSGTNRLEVMANVDRAARAAAQLAMLGYAVICPHTNSDRVSMFCSSLPYEYWIAADLALIARVDLVVLGDTWALSPGAIGEKEFAERHGIPVYTMATVPEVGAGGKRRDKQAAEMVEREGEERDDLY